MSCTTSVLLKWNTRSTLSSAGACAKATVAKNAIVTNPMILRRIRSGSFGTLDGFRRPNVQIELIYSAKGQGEDTATFQAALQNLRRRKATQNSDDLNLP